MGKEGELWDDSALIKAFDHAISKYKVIHGMNGKKETKETTASAEVDDGSNGFCSSTEYAQNEDTPYTAQETTAGIGVTTEILESKEELGSSSKCIVSSHIQDGSVLPTNGFPAAKSGTPGKHIMESDIKSQNEAISSSNDPEEYSKLLNKYYELEGQKQQILQQLNQNSNWNYQSTTEEYQEYVAQPYDTVTCHCSYGCQNWVVPCNSMPASCPDGSCVEKCCLSIHKDSQNENLMSPEDPDVVKMAMSAAERALSLTKEANGGKDKQLGTGISHFPESKSATDLHVVLKAWYSAGFYTGKYLSEQSMEKREHGQGP